MRAIRSLTGWTKCCIVTYTGVFMERKQLSEDGFEMTWAVNVVAPFLLQSLLLSQVHDFLQEYLRAGFCAYCKANIAKKQDGPSWAPASKTCSG